MIKRRETNGRGVRTAVRNDCAAACARDKRQPSMSEEVDTQTAASLTLKEAFDLIAHQVRQEILLELSEPDVDCLNPPTVSFTELYDRVEADVNTSQFNYHLQQLIGHFVEPSEATEHLNEAIAKDQGYSLSPEGLRLVWTIRSGATDIEPSLGSVAAGFECHLCGTVVDAEYRNGIFQVRCPGCEYHYEYNPTPPGILEGAEDPAEILDRMWRYNRTIRESAAREICPVCAAGLEPQLIPAAATNYPRRDHREAFVHTQCPHCGFVDYLTIGEFLLTDSRLIEFCVANGIDIVDVPMWSLPFIVTDSHVETQSPDPLEVRLRLETASGALVLEIGEDLNVRTVT